MEGARPHSLEFDKETRDLQGLLDAFASVCSLEEIASAYTTAEGNADIAGDILWNVQSSRSIGFSGSSSSSDTDSCLQSEKCLHDGRAGIPSADKVGQLKPKKMSISMGLVSDVLRKGSSRPNQSLDMSSKPIKLSEPETKLPDRADDALVADLLAKSQPLSNQDMEELLFAMLHDGFKLDKDKIQGVLRSCRYDLKKSMDELLEMSPLNPFKSNERSSNCTAHPTDKLTETQPLNSEDYAALASAQRQSSQISIMNVADSCYLEQQPDILNEVLEALFKDSKGYEEPKRTHLQVGLNRKRVPGRKPVSSPPVDVDTHQDNSENPLISKGASKGDSYEELERAVKHHWEMMKAYYDSAVDAVSKGDHDRANYLKDQGNYHANKTREAEEKCCQEITKMRSKDELKLELDICDAKEAVRLLKKHLRLLAGIPSLPLKVIIDSNKEDSTKGKRRKRVLKFLERASIIWSTAEGQEGTIYIEVDQLDPENLSFAGKEN